MESRSSSDPYVNAINNARLLSEDRVEVLLEVLIGPMEPVGINKEWKSHLIDALNTITQLRLDALEHDRAEELFRKEAMELRDVAVWSIGKLRGVINGIERKGRDRQAQANPRVPVWKCGCNRGEPDSCKDGIHTTIIPGQTKGTEDPGSHYAEDDRNYEFDDPSKRLR
jgi:hypothetical protein